MFVPQPQPGGRERKAAHAWITKNETKHPLFRACKRAGLRRVGWHVLRHTFASHLAMRGVPMRTIQELMGHSSLTMALRYAHLSPDVGRDAVAMLDAPSGPKALGHHLGSDPESSQRKAVNHDAK